MKPTCAFHGKNVMIVVLVTLVSVCYVHADDTSTKGIVVNQVQMPNGDDHSATATSPPLQKRKEGETQEDFASRIIKNLILTKHQWTNADVLQNLKEQDRIIEEASRAIRPVLTQNLTLRRGLLKNLDPQFQPDRELRQHTMDALGFQDTWAVNEIVKGLDREDLDIASSRALGNIGGPSAVQALKDILAGKPKEFDTIVRRDAVKGLIKSGKPGDIVATLRDFLTKETDPSAANHAVVGLGAMKDPANVETLKTFVLKNHLGYDLGIEMLAVSNAIKAISVSGGQEAQTALKEISKASFPGRHHWLIESALKGPETK